MDKSYLNQKWYARPNDLIGGWCIMNVDKPPSACDPSTSEVEIGSFLSEDIARHLVKLHNAVR